MTADPPAFDPRAPLPDGTTVLEASAGTGKTYTIAQLATRAVALEGMRLERLLAVTFTRAATGELRERIRERLAWSERLLAEGRAGGGDEIDALLAEGTPEEIAVRRERLRRALAEFDAATIVTLHGFCQAVLGTLGVAGDLDPDPTVVEEVDDLREQVLLDLYLRRFRTHQPMFGLDEAREIVRAAIGLPDVDVLPPDRRRQNDRAETRGRLARRAREELDARKRRARILTYDDLLLRLRDALVSDDGQALCERLRERWDLVLVDEFQDTDPIQWEVVERAFAAAGKRLVLIGDPKQAIYAFRGADVHAYLGAVARAGTLRTLAVNWRSDQDLIDAHDALMRGATLGHPDIGYRTVRAHHGARRLHDAPDPAALRFRVVDRYDPRIVRTAKADTVQVGSGRDFVAQDCADDIAALLAGGASIDTEDGRRPVQAGDIAVLCRKSENARRVHACLERAGVRVVLAGAGSVFETDAASVWLRLLEALERPSYEGAARLAALTPFVGWDAATLADASAAQLETVHARLHAWARILRTQGVAALAEAITAAEGLPARVLGTAGGERALTDLRHVGELLHRAGTADGLGATALATWLRRRIADARSGDEDQDRTRRLESDERAVQILTVHRSKGLEFPIVYLPDLWDIVRPPKEARPAAFHDEGGRRLLDVGLIGSDYRAHVQAKLAEDRGEDLRLFYVAVTRARHQAVVWWAGNDVAGAAPLTRLLLDRDADGSVGLGLARTPPDEEMLEALGEVAARAPGRVSVAIAGRDEPVALAAAAATQAVLEARLFDRPIDRSWRRTSYSALAAGAREQRVPVGTEVEDGLLADEPAADEEVVVPAGGSALQAMPAGREVGTAIHRVLEEADFAAADLPGELHEHLAAATARTGTDLGPLDEVAAALAGALATPLGPVLDGQPLTAIAPADRLDELTFELPLAGGDTPTGEVTLGRLAAVLHEHLPAGDPVRPYADLLATPGLGRAFRGYLTGSIDVVVRWRASDGDGWRFALADYKTNRLPGYEQPALLAEMQDKHYFLQALIYLVALHRHLRARLPDYHADRHLAGGAYLFLRGMAGPGEPGSGVVGWQPSGALLDALSGVFDG